MREREKVEREGHLLLRENLRGSVNEERKKKGHKEKEWNGEN